MDRQRGEGQTPSALCLPALLAGAATQDPSPGHFQKKTASALSLYTVLWQYLIQALHLQTPPRAFSRPKPCHKHPPSQTIALQGSSRTLLLFQAPRNHLKTRCRKAITGVLQREGEDPTPSGYSAAPALYVYVLPPVFMASLLWVSASLEPLPFLGEIPGRQQCPPLGAERRRVGCAEWLGEGHKAAPAVSTGHRGSVCCVVWLQPHCPVALVLSPSRVARERSAVALLLTNPASEMAWGCVFHMKSSFFPPALPQPL